MRPFIGSLALVVSMTSAFPALAQQGTADLRGRVSDSQQAVLPGVTVLVRNQESGLFRETVTGADGSFHFSAMTPGLYEIEAMLPGFRKFNKRDVRLEVGRTASVDVELAVGGLEETVTVSGESQLVDPSSKEIGGFVNAQELSDVPSFNRNFAGYLGMLPGVVTSISLTTFGADSISVAGQNIRNVNYTMDGSNNNDTFNGGNGGAQARVPLDAVQEFQLLTSQFDAEYGLASGGVVNAVSKSGTNQFKGSAFAYVQDDKVTSRDYFAEKLNEPKPPTRQQQFGGSLGGPIVQNRAHFFGTVERVILDGGVTINVPTRPEFNRTGIEETRVWNTFIRGDHQINSNHTWGVRWLRETSPQPSQIQTSAETPSRTEAETDVDWTVVGNLSSVFGSTRVNTFRVAAVSEDVFFGNPQFNGNGHDQKILDPTLNYQTFNDGQSARANRRLDVAYSADDTFAWFVPNWAGSHDFKFGFNYLYSTLRIQDFGNQNGTFTFSHDLAFDAANPRSYPEVFTIRVPGAVDFLMKGHFVGVFAQDKWRLNNRLTLTLGARYDVEVLPTPNEDNPLFAGDSRGYPMDTNNVSPRLGFSYALDGSARSVLRGGYGLFFQRTSYTFLTPMFSTGARYSTSFTARFPTSGQDNGPRNGTFPTNPLLQNGPVVNHAAIDALFPPGSRIQNTGTVRFDNPDREVAWARQYSIGYERQLGSYMAVTVDYIRSEQRKQYTLVDLNPPIRTNATVAQGQVRRINPLPPLQLGEFVGPVNTITNDGRIDYDTVQVSATRRLSQGISARVSYAYSRGEGNTATGQADTANSQLLGDLRLDNDIGPTAVDRPHILTINGSYDVPRTGGLKVSGVFRARSGTPFSIIDARFDPDQNGQTANDYLPAGSYSGTGDDVITVDYDGTRNGARGPNYMSLDLRAGYRFRLRGSRTIDAFLDVINATNEPNFSNPTGNRMSPDFLRLTDIADGGPTRTLQVYLKYTF
jgi:Carboxypeptidase regulatory-like domain/TonB dependent receptor/TonB-dependent Receptor Plug Domain